MVRIHLFSSLTNFHSREQGANRLLASERTMFRPLLSKLQWFGSSNAGNNHRSSLESDKTGQWAPVAQGLRSAPYIRVDSWARAPQHKVSPPPARSASAPR